MKKKKVLILALSILSALLAAALSSCFGNEIYGEGDGELNVLCTSFAPFDFTREVGGDRVTVSILQDSGADLHNYTPTAATLEAISRADVFIYIGGTSDQSWLPEALRAAGNDDLITLCLMDTIEPQYAHLEGDFSDHSHGDDHGGVHTHGGHEHGADEHIWTSVKNAKLMVNAIKDTLCLADPEGSDTYEANAISYNSQLDEIDAELEEISKDVPMMIFADRFPFIYLLHDYHIPYKAAFSGCSSETNAGFETQISLMNAVKDNALPCVFIIEGGDKYQADAISAETGCKIYSLNSMQSVKRSDIENGIKYIDVMKNNANILKEAYRGADQH